MELSYIRRTLLALGILGLSLAIVIAKGSNPISIIGGIVGFLVFSYNFRKIVIPVLFVIIFLLPITLSPFSFFDKFSVPFTRFYYPFVFHGASDFSHAEEPIKSISSARNISIDGPGFIVEFDKNAEDIKIPEGVITERHGDTLDIEAPGIKRFGKEISFGLRKTFRTKKIIIGTKSPINKLSINTMGVRILGYINPQRLFIDGMGVDVEGTLDLENMEIDGMGIRIRAKVVKAVSIEVDGMGADINLDYIQPWEGVWYLSVSGMGSKINYRVPPDNPGKLKIERNGLGNVVEHYGD